MTDLHDQVSALPAVSLDDLVDEAELLARVDRKYVVPAVAVPALLAAAAPGTRVLEIDRRRSFGYRSTYLDTPGLDSYLTSGRTHRHRWKVRSRTYLDTGSSWLEVKTAGPRGRTVKQRVESVARADGSLSPDGAGLVDSIVGADVATRLRPVLTTGYRRTTLLLPRSSARVTLDLDLTWTALRSGDTLRRPRLTIVETKTGSTPSSFDRLLWARGHRPVRISKYGTGMAALHPDLPHLKWHRVLDRYFDPPRPARDPLDPQPTHPLTHPHRSQP